MKTRVDLRVVSQLPFLLHVIHSNYFYYLFYELQLRVRVGVTIVRVPHELYDSRVDTELCYTIHELIQSYVIRVIVEFPFLGSTRSQGGKCHEK